MSEPKPRPKRPTAAELDERLAAPLTPEELAEGLIKAGPHPAEGDRDEKDQPASGR
jgi:hypothetical protein